MTTNRENEIESENEAPRLDDSKLAAGEGRSTVTSTCIQNGAGGLNPQGWTPADVDAEERTAQNRRRLKERMRIVKWNVRTVNQGKLDIMKKEMKRTGLELMGIREMKWTGWDTSCQTSTMSTIVDKIYWDGTVWLSCVQTKYEDELWNSTL